MQPYRLPALMLALFAFFTLAACDNADNSPTPTAQQQEAAAANAAAQRKKLAEQSRGKALMLLDASEVQLDGAAALALTFSVPLQPEQDFSRVAHVVDKKSGKVDGGWELSANLQELRLRHLEPNRQLIVTLDPALQALNDATLGRSVEKTLVTRDIAPAIGFASRGSLLPGKAVDGLPVIALNVNSVDVNFYRIRPESLVAFVSQWRYRSALSNWESDELLKMADLAYSGRFDLNPARNTRENLLLPLRDIQPLQQAGVYVAVMNPAGRYNYSNPATLFTLSDIGVSAHRYRSRLDLFTQSLTDGAAQSGVEVRLLNEKGQTLAQAVSDAQGHVALEEAGQAALLVASREGQTTLLDLKLPALDLAEFAIAGDPGYAKPFFMFGPRDLYRPGETVILNGLLRGSDGKSLPPQPVKLEVVKPDGQVVRRAVSQPVDGLYQFTYPLDGDAATGTWRIRADAGDDRPQEWAFHVEDFMPERMALSLTPQTTPLAPADKARFAVAGYYLYGAPANGNTLQGQLFLRPLREAVAALPGFQFGDIAEENLSRSLDQLQLTLDDKGRGEVVADSQWRETHSPLQLILQASLLESGGRPVTRRAQQAIWPAAALPGIRPRFATKAEYDYRSGATVEQPVVDENSLAAFDIVYADAQGVKKAVSGLQVRLIRERRDYYWDWSDSDGWRSQYDQKDLPVGERTLDLQAGETGEVSFPVEWGSYRLEVKAPDNVVSSVRFRAGYSWQDNSDGGGAARPDRVTLKLDKPAYKPGDTLRLHIAAPAAGKGYAMVESGDGPLWWQPIEVPAQGLDLAIPLAKEWDRHDLYLSALVVRPGDKSRAATPKRAVGLLHLPLSDDHRRLTVALDSPAVIRPNQELTVKVKVAAQAGATPQRVNLLLSAVDSGVLNITDYATPDPWRAFFGQKRYGADIYDIYGQLIEGLGRQAALRFGGDGDALARGGKPPINHLAIVAQQTLPVVLDERGEGTVTLPIGDFNGELRLMAQAWTAEEFGSGERRVAVAAPAVVELNSPRFLAGGDSARLALDIRNLTDRPQRLQVALATDGLLTLEREQPQPVQLPPGARTTLFAPVSAREGFGEGAIGVVVSGLSLPGEDLPAIRKRWTIGVRPAWPAQTVNSAITLPPGESWRAPPAHLDGFTPAALRGQLLLSGKPPLNLARYIRELKAYPYGCLEQTASGLFPSLYVNAAQLSGLGIVGDSDERRRAAVATGIARLLQMQRDDGGFALWDKEGEEEYWLTAYAMDFLLRAGEQGYEVPAEALERGDRRLLRYLQEPGLMTIRYSSDPQAGRFAARAYAALVLARQQKAPLGALRQLWESRDQARSGLPLLQLGIALKAMGDAPRAEQALSLALTTPRQDKDQWLADYGSELRDNAMMLMLLEENALLPEAQNSLLNALSAQAAGARWLSTQESNALFMAGRSLMTTPGDWRAQTSLQMAPLGGDSAQIRNLDADQLAALTVTNSGDQPLWLRLDSSGYPQYAPPASGEALHIERQFLDLDGNIRPLSSLRSGDLLLVRLQVTASRNVPDALVVDLLPAGLELENQNLANSSASLRDNGGGVADLLRRMQQADIRHIEFRDDRFVAAVALNEQQPVTLLYLARAVTPGSYQLPAPQVESMYVPQWRAIGATDGPLIVTP